MIRVFFVHIECETQAYILENVCDSIKQKKKFVKFIIIGLQLEYIFWTKKKILTKKIGLNALLILIQSSKEKKKNVYMIITYDDDALKKKAKRLSMKNKFSMYIRCQCN